MGVDIMSAPVPRETLMYLADVIEYAAANYGSMIDTEEQAGEIAVPTTTAKGDGHLVKVLYTGFTPDRYVLWCYDLTNTGWKGVELL